MFLENTFFDAGGTWTEPRGHSHRIDYVGLDATLHQGVVEWLIDDNIDLSTAARYDHSVVAVVFCIAPASLKETAAHRSKTPGRLDKWLLQSQGHIDAFREHLRRCPCCCPKDSIDVHLESALKHVQEGLHIFESKQRKPRKVVPGDLGTNPARASLQKGEEKQAGLEDE